MRVVRSSCLATRFTMNATKENSALCVPRRWKQEAGETGAAPTWLWFR